MSEYELVPVGERAGPADYIRLFERAYGATTKLTERYLAWLYDENPHGRAVGFDAYLGDALGAHYVTVPRLYRVGAAEVPLLLSLNTATDPDHQRRGLFKRLAFATYERGAELGYHHVIGVANAQSIHGFQKSLGFETLGRVRLALGRRPERLAPDAPHIAVDAEWLAWRLTNPSAAYFATPAGGGDVILNTSRGNVTFSIGRTGADMVKGLPALPRKSFRGLASMTPVFPTAGRGPFLPERLMPSPWHVIVRPLAAPDTQALTHLQFDGLSMDTF